MNESTWGALFLVYILAGLPLLSLQAADEKKADLAPRTKKLTWAWIAGLCALLLAWTI